MRFFYVGVRMMLPNQGKSNLFKSAFLVYHAVGKDPSGIGCMSELRYIYSMQEVWEKSADRWDC